MSKSLVGKKCAKRRRYLEAPPSIIGIGGEESIDRIQCYIERSQNDYKDCFLWNGYDYDEDLYVYHRVYISRETFDELTKEKPYPYDPYEYIDENFDFDGVNHFAKKEKVQK